MYAEDASYQAEIYNAGYFEVRGHTAGSETPGIAAAKRRTFQHYLRKLGGSGNLLEIGCSTGIGLLEAEALGWKTHGVEVSEAAAAAARARVPSADVRLDSRTFGDGAFQAVVLFDVIEHFSVPADIGPELQRLAAPGGELLLITPDVGSLSARLMGGYWPHYLDEHLNYYCRQSMEDFLKRYGFELRECGWAGKYVTVSMLRRHAQVRAAGAFDQVVGFATGLAERAAGDRLFWFNVGELYALAIRTR